MSGIHFLTPSFVSGATATANHQAAANTGADNLLSTQASRKYRSNGVTPNIQITVDAGSAKPWDSVLLHAHNGVSGDTIRLTANASTGSLFSAPSYSSGALPLVFAGDLSSFTQRDIWINTGSTHNFRYLGIEVVATTNPDGYFEAGVLVVGQNFEPKIGAQVGYKFGIEDPSVMIRLVNGEPIIRPKKKYTVAGWTFPYQDEADWDRFLTINRVYGSSIPVGVKIDTESSIYEANGVMFGQLRWRSGGAVTFVNAKPLYDVDVEFVGF